MIPEIECEAKQRGITRLCHFTPSRNLVHILSGKVGVLATKHLEEDERRIFTPTDLERLDHHEGYICCSVQYPNAWYFDNAQAKDTLFKDWVVLLINPKYLWQPGTRFCPRNAASAQGRNIVEGANGFLELFSNSVLGAHGKTRSRSSRHFEFCPTDDQAEVLVPDQIQPNDILEIAVRSKEQAQNEMVRLKYAGISIDKLRFLVASKFFKKHELSNAIRTGILVKEELYTKIDT